jgi:hypothetical protein
MAILKDKDEDDIIMNSYVHRPMCCPTSGGCCQYARAIPIRTMGNSSIINMNDESDIPPYETVMSKGTTATWMTVGLLGVLMMLLIVAVILRRRRE